MSEIFEHNTVLLERYSSDVTRHINLRPQHYFTKHQRLALCMAKNGSPSLLVNNKAIHSTYHPQREANKLVNSLLTLLPPDLPHYTFVIYEAGLGYYIESLVKQCPSPATLLIIIYDRDVFEYAINTRSISSWFAQHEVCVFVQPTAHQLTTKLQSYAFTHIEELYVPALITADHTAIGMIKSEITSYHTRQAGNRNTTEKFGALWVRNGIKNTRYLHSAGNFIDISLLHNAFSNIPAVVVGAGPTVDTLLEVLRSLSESCIIIAVDTAVRTLQLHNINPHFIVNVDPQYWNSQHLQQVNFERSWLIHDICTHPVITQSTNPRILMWSAVPIAQLLQPKFGIKQSVSAGGTVTTSAWEVARWFGCTRVYLAGVDFAFPWNNIHCAGALFEQEMLLKAHALASAETELLCYLHHTPIQSVLDYTDSEVLTNQSLITYAQWLNTQHTQRKDFPTYTLSQYGLKLDAIQYLDPTTISLMPLDIANIICNTLSRIQNNITTKDNNIWQADTRLEAISLLTSILSELLEWLQPHVQLSIRHCVDKINQLIDNRLETITKHNIAVSMLRETVLMICNVSAGTPHTNPSNHHRHTIHSIDSTLRQLATLKI